MRKYKLPTSRLSKVIVGQSYITDKHYRNYIPCRFAGGQNIYNTNQHMQTLCNRQRATYTCHSYYKTRCSAIAETALQGAL